MNLPFNLSYLIQISPTLNNPAQVINFAKPGIRRDISPLTLVPKIFENQMIA